MKKFAVVILLFLFASIPSYAQQLKIGVKGGPGLVDVVAVRTPDGFGGEDSYYKMRPSYHFGVFGLIDLSSRFYVQTELLYANKGFRSNDPGASEANIHLHYLTLPLLLSYKISENVHVAVGGELGYRLAARSKFDNSNLDVNAIYKREIDVGIDAGLQYYFSSQINLGVRYIHGLSNIFGRRGVLTDINGNPFGKGPSFQNRVVQFSVGYTFGDW